MKTTLKKTFLAAAPLAGLLMIAPVAFAHDPYDYDQYGYEGGPYYDDYGGSPYDQYGYGGGRYYDDDSCGDSYGRYGYGGRPSYGDPYAYGRRPYYDDRYYPGSSSYPRPYSSLPSLLGLPLDILLPR